MWSYWPHWTVTFRWHWDSLPLSVKQLGWGLGWGCGPQLEEDKLATLGSRRVVAPSGGGHVSPGLVHEWRETEQEIDRQTGAYSVVWIIYLPLVPKNDQSWKVMLSIYQSAYFLTLTFGKELWLRTEIMRLQIQIEFLPQGGWIQDDILSSPFLCVCRALV